MIAERERALRFLIDELEQSWDTLVEEAKRDLNHDDGEENNITYRYAVLLFAIKKAPQAPSHYAKPFRQLVRAYLAEEMID